VRAAWGRTTPQRAARVMRAVTFSDRAPQKSWTPCSDTDVRVHSALRPRIGPRREPFVLFPRTSAPGLFDHIVAFCRSAGFSPRIEQEAVQSEAIVG
jgi:hypothetical protein